MASFALGKWGSNHTRTGIWSHGTGKKYEKSKMGMGFEIYEVGVGKKNELENGIGIAPSRPSNNVPLCDHITSHLLNLNLLKLSDIIKLQSYMVIIL